MHNWLKNKNKNPVGDFLNKVTFNILIYNKEFYKIFPWYYKYLSNDKYTVIELDEMTYNHLELITPELYYRDMVRIYCTLHEINHSCEDNNCKPNCPFKFIRSIKQ